MGAVAKKSYGGKPAGATASRLGQGNQQSGRYYNNDGSPKALEQVQAEEKAAIAQTQAEQQARVAEAEKKYQETQAQLEKARAEKQRAQSGGGVLSVFRSKAKLEAQAQEAAQREEQLKKQLVKDRTRVEFLGGNYGQKLIQPNTLTTGKAESKVVLNTNSPGDSTPLLESKKTPAIPFINSETATRQAQAGQHFQDLVTGKKTPAQVRAEEAQEDNARLEQKANDKVIDKNLVVKGSTTYVKETRYVKTHDEQGNEAVTVITTEKPLGAEQETYSEQLRAGAVKDWNRGQRASAIVEYMEGTGLGLVEPVVRTGASALSYATGGKNTITDDYAESKGIKNPVKKFQIRNAISGYEDAQNALLNTDASPEFIKGQEATRDFYKRQFNKLTGDNLDNVYADLRKNSDVRKLQSGQPTSYTEQRIGMEGATNVALYGAFKAGGKVVEEVASTKAGQYVASKTAQYANKIPIVKSAYSRIAGSETARNLGLKAVTYAPIETYQVATEIQHGVPVPLALLGTPARIATIEGGERIAQYYGDTVVVPAARQAGFIKKVYTLVPEKGAKISIDPATGKPLDERRATLLLEELQTRKGQPKARVEVSEKWSTEPYMNEHLYNPMAKLRTDIAQHNFESKYIDPDWTFKKPEKVYVDTGFDKEITVMKKSSAKEELGRMKKQAYKETALLDRDYASLGDKSGEFNALAREGEPQIKIANDDVGGWSKQSVLDHEIGHYQDYNTLKNAEIREQAARLFEQNKQLSGKTKKAFDLNAKTLLKLNSELQVPRSEAKAVKKAEITEGFRDYETLEQPVGKRKKPFYAAEDIPREIAAEMLRAYQKDPVKFRKVAPDTARQIERIYGQTYEQTIVTPVFVEGKKGFRSTHEPQDLYKNIPLDDQVYVKPNQLQTTLKALPSKVDPRAEKVRQVQAQLAQEQLDKLRAEGQRRQNTRLDQFGVEQPLDAREQARLNNAIKNEQKAFLQTGTVTNSKGEPVFYDPSRLRLQNNWGDIIETVNPLTGTITQVNAKTGETVKLQGKIEPNRVLVDSTPNKPSKPYVYKTKEKELVVEDPDTGAKTTIEKFIKSQNEQTTVSETESVNEPVFKKSNAPTPQEAIKTIKQKVKAEKRSPTRNEQQLLEQLGDKEYAPVPTARPQFVDVFEPVNFGSGRFDALKAALLLTPEQRTKQQQTMLRLALQNQHRSNATMQKIRQEQLQDPALRQRLVQETGQNPTDYPRTKLTTSPREPTDTPYGEIYDGYDTTESPPVGGLITPPGQGLDRGQRKYGRFRQNTKIKPYGHGNDPYYRILGISRYSKKRNRQLEKIYGSLYT